MRFPRTPTIQFVAKSMVCIYLAIVIAIAAGMYCFGDRTWWGTLLLFAPRWLWALPLPIIVLISIVFGRIWIRLAAVCSGAILFFWIMGFAIPIAPFFATFQGQRVRVVTCNLAGSMVDYSRLRNLLGEVNPDVAAFQEAGMELEANLPAGWNSVRAGEIVIVSRSAIAKQSTEYRTSDSGNLIPDCTMAEIHLASGSIAFAAVHFATPRDGISRVLDAQTIVAPSRRDHLEWETNLRRKEQLQARAAVARRRIPFIVAGDFNSPVESTIYRGAWRGLRNAFSNAGWGFGCTIKVTEHCLEYWARIDHILYDRNWSCRSCWTGRSIGSDHIPLIADLYGSPGQIP